MKKWSQMFEQNVVQLIWLYKKCECESIVRSQKWTILKTKTFQIAGFARSIKVWMRSIHSSKKNSFFSRKRITTIWWNLKQFWIDTEQTLFGSNRDFYIREITRFWWYFALFFCKKGLFLHLKRKIRVCERLFQIQVLMVMW